MKPARLDALADGIFAIVMTLLVIEFRVPDLPIGTDNTVLWDALRSFGPLLMSYVLSFGVLFTYWRAHHYIMGIYAKTVDIHLMNINALFFLFVALIPFSSVLLGLYSTTLLAIAIYGVNVILIGITIWWMRYHVLFTEHVESEGVSEVELRHGTARTVLPVFFATLAILLGFWNTNLSLILFTLAVIYNLLPQSTRLTDRLLGYK